ncbi:class I SAM-dependent methyltransferase [Bradyrhizobium sp. 23]|uniref:class I SAM-dependent methyltransferase n=1 Tax=Bradyrhizobium sp. 23 TaxID=2782667 RepID=UPI001FF8EBD0|nr:class I SAM-dependent methyltransferase [Bradyrhizobium sp. 23]MCK1313389.1 class I SAM-dependent methyltransferase [Bradyrhizobium sp. 23]
MDHLSDSERRRVTGLYESRIAEHGLTVDALKSGGTGKQWVRHAVHAEAFDLNGLHILDVGCGLAMFYRFLRRRGVVPASYTGIDIVEPFLEANRKAFPEGRFLAMDIFEDSLADLRPDVAFMSQVFNNKYDTADNEAVARAAIARFFDVVRVGLVIDFMSTYVDWQDPELHYFTPETNFSYAKTLTRFVELRHDYLPFEHTLILRKGPGLVIPDDAEAREAY